MTGKVEGVDHGRDRRGVRDGGWDGVDEKGAAVRGATPVAGHVARPHVEVVRTVSHGRKERIVAELPEDVFLHRQFLARIGAS